MHKGSGQEMSVAATPAASLSLSRNQELSAFRDMLLIRRFEEKAGQMYAMGLIGGYCHLYIGQEAIAVGAQMAAGADDQVITGYRNHGHLIACGVDPKLIMAELAGRRSGLSGGKGGSIHMFAPEMGFYGGHGMMGAQISIGTGLAFANHYRGSKQVCLAFMGDGAAFQGQVFESFALAARWNLPLVYIIENNSDHEMSGTSLSQRGVPFGIQGRIIDGTDVRAVWAATSDAIAHCRSGAGPLILEMQTSRYRGHSLSDPVKYRSRAAVRPVGTGQDPIEALRARLLAQDYASIDDLARMDKSIRAIVAEASEFAVHDEEPSASELFTHVAEG